jgi:hypothetical protein
MIADWRAKWAIGTGGATSPQFPFGFVQLNGYGGGTRGGPYVPKYNNPVDTDYDNEVQYNTHCTHSTPY